MRDLNQAKIMAFKGLENALMELASMSHLMVGALERIPGERLDDGRRAMLFDDQADLNTFGFTIYETERRIEILQREFLAVFDLGDANV